MKPKIYLGFLIILAALLIAIPVQAITFGQADGNAHPNVGMLWVEIDGGLYGVCSGTKVPAADGLGQDVFLTAAHCLAWAPPGVTWFVTFDSDASDPYAANLIQADGAFYHPGYNHDMADLHDLGIVLLPEGSTNGIDPAQMPTEGFLDTSNSKNGLKGTQFLAVGYGATRVDKTKGFQPLYYEDIRQFAAGTFSALTKSWLHISMNPATGDGGTCYGDSGGPHFFGDSNLIVSITVTGDSPCRASDVTYRLDTASAQSFLSAYIDFP